MRIACLFISHFPVAVEYLRQPELRGQPLVIGGTPAERKIVVDCSPEAARCGVRPGTSLREALSRCHEAVFVETHQALYQEVAMAIERTLGLISPLVEPAGPGHVFVGLAGLELSYPSEAHLARVLQRSVVQATRLEPKIGVAGGRFTAYAAALFSTVDKPRIVAPNETLGFLAKLSVEHLPVSEEMLRRLRLLGIRTVGQLAALPLGAMQAQFGPEGRLAWELAHGIDTSYLQTQNLPTVLVDQLSLPAPVTSVDALLAAARHLLPRLINQPAFRYRAARGLIFRLMLTNGHILERRLNFREPLSDQGRILFALENRLREIVLSAPIEGLELALSDICAEGGTQGDLFVSDRVRQLNRVVEAVRQLKSRYGRTPISKVVEVEPWSRIPERRLALIDYDP